MRRFYGLVAAASVAVAPQAHAAVFNLAYATASDSASLVLTTTDAATGGYFTVTGISGERDGLAVTGLSSYAAGDQRFSPADPFVTFSGLSYTAGGQDYNFFADPAKYEISSSLDPDGAPNHPHPILTESVAAVPEPAGAAMLAAGLAGLVFAARRRAAV